MKLVDKFFIFSKETWGKRVFLFISAFTFFYYRFYNLGRRIIFDWDQETLSFQLKSIIHDHDLILIGHRATDAMGFYFGPYFEYLFVPFYFFSNLHPTALIPFIIAINILFFISSLYFLTRIFNIYISLGFLFFWAVNPILIIYDITVWAPILMPLGYLLTFYLLWKIYHDPSVKNFILLGIVLGFFTQIHSLFFLMNLYVGIFFLTDFFLRKNFSKKLLKKLMLTVMTSAVFFTPLIIFDLRHNFLNSKLFVGYFTNRTQGTPLLTDSLIVFSNFFKPLTGVSSPLIGSIIYVLMLGLFIYLSRIRKKFHKVFYISATGILLLTAVIYLRYSTRPSEYYFLYLCPFLVIALLDFFYHSRKSLVIVVCAIFLLINFSKLQTITKSSSRGLYGKEAIVLFLKDHINNRPFNITYEMPLGIATGYKYLLDYHHLNSSGREKDPLVILRFPPKKGDVEVNGVGIYIPEKLKK